MLLTVVRIGNSRGIRIPKTILEQCAIDKELELEVEDGKIVLRPRKAMPRAGWKDAFKRMAAAGDDRPLIDEALDIDLYDFEW